MARIKIVRTGGKVVFEPDPATVNKTDRVFWLNDDNVEHEICLTPGEVLKPGDTSSEVLITEDTTYWVVGHPDEKGSITIKKPNVVA